MRLHQTEEQAQRIVCQWLSHNGVSFCHVPNGGLRSKTEAARFKGLGVRAGVPDILIFTPPPIHKWSKGVAIEMKRGDGKGRISADQKAWLELLWGFGWEVKIAHGSNEAIDWLESLGYGKEIKR